MARPILSEYGPDAHKPQAERASSGGVKRAVDVMNYREPQGPKHRHEPGPGLRGGNNYGNAGSQGKSSLACERSGSPGLHGENKGMGTNRG